LKRCGCNQRAIGKPALADVIDRMAKGHPISRLDELLPRNWQQSRIKLAAASPIQG
jgi:hypothetical protein